MHCIDKTIDSHRIHHRDYIGIEEGARQYCEKHSREIFGIVHKKDGKLCFYSNKSVSLEVVSQILQKAKEDFA